MHSYDNDRKEERWMEKERGEGWKWREERERKIEEECDRDEDYRISPPQKK